MFLGNACTSYFIWETLFRDNSVKQLFNAQRRILNLSLLVLMLATLSVGYTTSQAQSSSGDEFPITDVIAQRNINQTAFNTVTNTRGMHLGGVHMHKYPDSSQVMYLYDSGNSRILAFLNPDWRNPSELPDRVFGQNDSYVLSACNGNNNAMTTPPTNRTLCINPGAHTVSQEESPRFTSMDTDGNGNLFVIDQYNNRILMFLDPFGSDVNEGDTTADLVWGQVDFNSKICNRGKGLPPYDANFLSSDSLCTTNSIAGSIDPFFVTALDLDQWGNMWVTDIINNRVLRFPYVANTGKPRLTADLVLGQPSMNAFAYDHNSCDTTSPGTAFCQLISLKVNPTTGELFVVHYYENPRITVYSPNTNAQNPTSYHYSRTIGQGILRYPGFIQFLDANRFIIEDEYHPFNDLFRIFATNGTQIRTLDSNQIIGVSKDGQVKFEDIHGQFSIIDNHLFLTEQSKHNSVLVFNLSRFETANQLIFSGEILGGPDYIWNTTTGLGLSSPLGFAVSETHSQVFISGGYRILVWNSQSDVTFAGRAADFVIGQPSFNTNSPYTEGNFIFRDKSSGLAVDEINNKLWVAVHHDVFAFDLPITSSSPLPSMSFQTQIPEIPDTGNLPVRGTREKVVFRANSVAFNPIDQTLWIIDAHNSRVLRVSNPYTNPEVDLILGQNTLNGMTCNRGDFKKPTAKSLCFPGFAAFDSRGNLYIAEGVFEGRADAPGNKRIVEYDKATIDQAAQIGVLSEPAADRVYAVPAFTTNPVSDETTFFSCVPNTPCNPIALAFDNSDRMLVLSDAYFNPFGKQIYLYTNPLRNKGAVSFDVTQDIMLPYGMGQGGQPAFSDPNIMYLQDHTWNRVIVAKSEIKPAVMRSQKNITLNEGGGSAQLMMRLATQPAADVALQLSFDPVNKAATDRENLLFTSSNWNVPQAITLTAIDNQAAEGQQVVKLKTMVNSTDPAYAQLSVGNITLTVIDNDIVKPPSAANGVNLSKQTATVSENGLTDTYTVRLSNIPFADVTVSLSSTPGNQVAIEPAMLVFTPATWDIPQIVTLRAVPDLIQEDAHTVLITHQSASSDQSYNAITIPPVVVTVSDNELELLANGDFELDTFPEDGLPDTWTVLNPTQDKMRCSGEDIIPHSGKCLFQFKGRSSENTKVYQVVSLASEIPSTSTLKAQLYYFTNWQQPKLKVKLQIYYADGTVDKRKTTVQQISTEYALVTVKPYRLKGDRGGLTQIKFSLRNKGRNGKLYIDDVSVKVQPDVEASRIPLP